MADQNQVTAAHVIVTVNEPGTKQVTAGHAVAEINTTTVTGQVTAAHAIVEVAPTAVTHQVTAAHALVETDFGATHQVTAAHAIVALDTPATHRVSAGHVIVTTRTPDPSNQLIIEVDWDDDGSYTEEATYLVTASGSNRLRNAVSGYVGRSQIDRASIVFDNTSNRFSTLLTGAALYSDTAGGKAYHRNVRINVDVAGAGEQRVFTGVIKIPKENTVAPGQPQKIVFEARSREEEYLNRFRSTTQANFATYHDDGKTESELISQWLTDAGVTLADIEVDPGVFVIPWGWIDDESPIVDCWDLASAAGGVFYATQDGKFVYENASHWQLEPHDTVRETLTSTEFASLEMFYDDKELARSVISQISAREIDVAQVVYSIEAAFVIPPTETKTIKAQLRAPLYELTAVDLKATTSGGTNITSDQGIVRTDNAQHLEFAITNNNATHDAIISRMDVSGRPVIGGINLEVTQNTTSTFWNNHTHRSKRLPSNVYVQTLPQGEMLATLFRDQLNEPRLMFRARNCVGDPGRRLGDRVTVSDSNLLTTARAAFIIGIDWRLSAQGFYQDLTLIDAQDLFEYDGNYATLDTDTLGGGKRIFY